MELDLRDQVQLYLGLYEREAGRYLLRLMPRCVACVGIGAHVLYVGVFGVGGSAARGSSTGRRVSPQRFCL